MKKLLAWMVVLAMVFAFTAVAFADGEVMSYADYAAAELDSPVVVETFVQAHQSWWDGKVTVYAQDEDGAVFIYNMACSEEDAEKLVPGAKIKVTGFKSEWAGEVEIVDATFEFVDGEPFVAEAEDVTALLGTDELAEKQNKLVAFKGMTVEAYDESGAAFAYKNDVDKTDDLYFKVSKDGNVYDFCVEFYLCGKDTDVYKAVEALEIGQVIDLEGFLYWYEGANPHITSVKPHEETAICALLYPLGLKWHRLWHRDRLHRPCPLRLFRAGLHHVCLHRALRRPWPHHPFLRSPLFPWQRSRGKR